MLLGSTSSSGGSSLSLLPNGTFLVELVIFIVVLAVVAKVILPPLQGAMRSREQTVRGALRASDEGHAEAERLAAERREVLASARAEARRALEEASRSADERFEDARRRAQEEFERLLEAARPGIEAERTQVRADVFAQIPELVVAAATRVIGRPVEAERHRALIAETLNEQLLGDGR